MSLEDELKMYREICGNPTLLHNYIHKLVSENIQLKKKIEDHEKLIDRWFKIGLKQFDEIHKLKNEEKKK